MMSMPDVLTRGGLMTSKTGTVVPGMLTEGMMTAAVDTGAKAEAPELMIGMGAADVTI